MVANNDAPLELTVPSPAQLRATFGTPECWTEDSTGAITYVARSFRAWLLQPPVDAHHPHPGPATPRNVGWLVRRIVTGEGDVLDDCRPSWLPSLANVELAPELGLESASFSGLRIEPDRGADPVSMLTLAETASRLTNGVGGLYSA